MYIVQTWTDFGGWENTWTETLPDGTERPLKFKTKKEAQKEIDELVKEMGYLPDDYRIVEEKP